MTTIATEEAARRARAVEAWSTYKGLVVTASQDPSRAKDRDDFRLRYSLDIAEGERLEVEAERQRTARVHQLRDQVWHLDRELRDITQRHNAAMREAKELTLAADRDDMGPDTIGGRAAITARERAATLVGTATAMQTAHKNMSTARASLVAQLADIGGAVA